MDSLKNSSDILAALARHRYVADDELATVLFLLLSLRKPLLLEGPPGVGKTEIAVVLSELLDAPLIRLQCYEGLDLNAAVYEWNYQKQLLGIRLYEGEDLSVSAKEKHIFGPDYLLKRPLLQSITHETKSPVLLIDELDRSDEEFEAFLLELLSAFQISIPEMGTVRATHRPYIVLTSNRTRELSDALKRRCLYHWLDYPSLEKEMAIVHARLPHIEAALLTQVVEFVQQVRGLKLSKVPGISETIDWAESLMVLGHRSVSRRAVDQTLGALLKSVDDIRYVRDEAASLRVE